MEPFGQGGNRGGPLASWHSKEETTSLINSRVPGIPGKVLLTDRKTMFA